MLKFVVKMNLNGLNRQMMAILADEVFVFWLNFGQGTQTSTSDPNRQKNFHRQDLKKRRQRMNQFLGQWATFICRFEKYRQKASQAFKKQCLSSNRMIIILNSRGKLYKERQANKITQRFDLIRFGLWLSKLRGFSPMNSTVNINGNLAKFRFLYSIRVGTDTMMIL